MSDTQRAPGLLVARRVLWRIAMLCTIVGLSVVVATSLIPGGTEFNGFQAVAVIAAAVVYIGVAVWIAYAIVRMVGRERLSPIK